MAGVMTTERTGAGGARRERGILFSPAMVRAVLAGEKTQTRRGVKPQPPSEPIAVERYHPTVVDRHGEEGAGPEVFGAHGEEWGRVCPYGAPGDRAPTPVYARCTVCWATVRVLPSGRWRAHPWWASCNPGRCPESNRTARKREGRG